MYMYICISIYIHHLFTMYLSIHLFTFIYMYVCVCVREWPNFWEQFLGTPKNPPNHKMLMMKSPFPFGVIHILPLGLMVGIPPCANALWMHYFRRSTQKCCSALHNVSRV